jgi:hypothetical protein
MVAAREDKLATAADIAALHAELARLRAQLAFLCRRLPADGGRPRLCCRAELVTLGEAADLVGLPRQALERRRDKMPAPAVIGRPGRPNRWDWSELRPWLMAAFGLFPPEHLPEAPR